MSCWCVRLDGQEDVEGVGQSLEEEEKGMDSGAAWAVGADPALLDRVALVAGPGQGRGPAVHRDAEPLQYGRDVCTPHSVGHGG